LTAQVNLRELTAGDDYELEVTVLDDAGAPRDILGVPSIKFALARRGEVVVEKTLGNGIEITNAAAGRILVYLDAADTEGLSGNCTFEVEVIDLAGKYQTPVYGTVPFRRAIIANT
jgi:hypothetical protein